MTEEDVIGKWKSKDGKFTYEAKENGQLIVGSPCGTDDNSCWYIEDGVLVFFYSDDGKAWFTYNSEDDILECSGSPESWILVRY